MAYSNCPRCGFSFSWLRKWKLSTTRPYACPQCHVGLLKNADSEKRITWGVVLLLVPQVFFGLGSAAKRLFHFTVPDFIELPLCLLIGVPALIVGAVMSVKGLATAKFELVEDSERAGKADIECGDHEGRVR